MSMLPFAPGDDEYDHSAAGMAVALAFSLKWIFSAAALAGIAGVIYIAILVF